MSDVEERVMDRRLEEARKVPAWYVELHGTEPPNDNALQNAEEVLRILDMMEWVSDDIRADCDNGVQFGWQRGKRHARVSCMNEAGEDPSDIICLCSQGDGEFIPIWCVRIGELVTDIAIVRDWVERGIWRGRNDVYSYGVDGKRMDSDTP